MAHASTEAASPHHSRHRYRYLLMYGFIFVALILVFGRQLDSLAESIRAVQSAEPLQLLLAVGLVGVGYLAAAQSYVALAAPRLHFAPTLVVQTASGFANRLLPAGLGNLGLFGVYIHRRGHPTAAASGIVVANNILGIVGNLALVGFVLIVWPQYVSGFDVSGLGKLPVVATAVVAVLVVGGWLLNRYAKVPQVARSRSFLQSSWHALQTSVRINGRTLTALGCNMLLTTLNGFVLCLCAWSVGADIAWPAALLALTLGTALGAVVPTPGGIGGVEAGLLAGLTVTGIPPALALAAVLLYRLCSYWLPIIPGIAAFRYVERHYL
jgi:uncharacterized membrane protein YbhN (UPF0104 family)